MLELVHSTDNKTERTVEVVVHISEYLEAPRRGTLVAALKNNKGIVAAEFCHLRSHLILVRYDTEACTSRDVLGSFKLQKIHARLIGPV